MGKGRTPCCEKGRVKKGPWSQDEDLKLISFIHRHGHSNWRSLPKLAGPYPSSILSIDILVSIYVDLNLIVCFDLDLQKFVPQLLNIAFSSVYSFDCLVDKMLYISLYALTILSNINSGVYIVINTTIK